MFASSNAVAARHISVFGVFVAGVIAVLSLAVAKDAQALCSRQPIAGTWINVDAATNSVTRARVHFNCNDFIAVPAGEPRPALPPAFEVEVWGKCLPSDCAWGRVPARSSRPSGITTLTSRYNHGFARRLVTMRLFGDILELHFSTDFVDPARRDYATTVRMRRL